MANLLVTKILLHHVMNARPYDENLKCSEQLRHMIVDTYRDLVRSGYLETGYSGTYKLTEGGKMFTNALNEIQLPVPIKEVVRWEFPKS